VVNAPFSNGGAKSGTKKKMVGLNGIDSRSIGLVPTEVRAAFSPLRGQNPGEKTRKSSSVHRPFSIH